jgi:hypothetical protein
MEQNQSASQKVQALLSEQTQLLANKARAADQLKAIEDRLRLIDAALEGTKLGQDLAAEVAAEAAATQPKDPA